MTTVIDPARPRRTSRRSGRIIERTTTITREIYIDYPDLQAPTSPSANDHAADDQTVADQPGRPLSGLSRLAVRAGITLTRWGRRRATLRAAHRPTGTAEMSRRLDERKDRDLAFLVGIPR